MTTQPCHLHVVVTAEQDSAVRAEAAKTGAPVAEVVRRAIAHYLLADGKPKKVQRA